MKKKFAYCIGGCRTVPPYLADLTTDRADCFAVFFKEPGPPGTIYLPNSTTNTGRNEAFRQASLGDYEYVVIMDDDVKFEGKTHAEGFRQFEALLDEFNPAIAVPRYSWHLRGQNKYSRLDLTKRVQGLNATDAIVNAFHRDVWNLYLPYWTGADHICWWDAQQIVHRLCMVLMPGSFVQFNELHVINDGSMVYPRSEPCVAADKYLREFVKPEHHDIMGFYRDPESFHEVPADLRQSYKLSREFIAERCDLNHEYWRDRI